MTHSFTIGDRQVGRGHKPFIIAEMSCNHMSADVERKMSTTVLT